MALLAHVGIGAPGGALGLDLDVAPIPNFAFGASVGVSPGEGLQLALMPDFGRRWARSPVVRRRS